VEREGSSRLTIRRKKERADESAIRGTVGSLKKGSSSPLIGTAMEGGRGAGKKLGKEGGEQICQKTKCVTPDFLKGKGGTSFEKGGTDSS